MLDFQSEVKAKIAEADPQHPMDGGPFKGNVDEMGQLLLFLNLMANYTLYVVKVPGKVEGIEKLNNHKANQESFAKMFFVRGLQQDDDGELDGMYLVFLPNCPERPIKMEQLPYLDTESPGEPLEIVAAKLFLFEMELKAGCIISAVPPDDEKHPVNAYGLGMANITEGY